MKLYTLYIDKYLTINKQEEEHAIFILNRSQTKIVAHYPKIEPDKTNMKNLTNKKQSM
jgi:hypothetical protein